MRTHGIKLYANMQIIMQLLSLTLSAKPLSDKSIFHLLNFSSFKNMEAIFNDFACATAAASDVAVMSGMPDIGT